VNGTAAWRLGGPLLNALVTLVVIIGLWWAFVTAFSLDPLIAKTPADVWSYLIHGANAGSGAQSV
jgi:ABC-type nitrate/sulfonate/bicarbonate transport system permease component